MTVMGDGPKSYFKISKRFLALKKFKNCIFSDLPMVSTGQGNQGSQGKVREKNPGQGNQGKVRENEKYMEKSGKTGILRSCFYI